MKKVSLVLLTLFIAFQLSAQTNFEFIPTGGYTFQDRVNYYNNYGRIDESLNWGGSLMFNVNQRFGIELLYDHMDTKSGIFNYGSQTPTSQQDVGINYILAGPVSSIYIPGSSIHPFFGAMLGAAVFSPGTSGYSSNTQFAWGAELGTNIYISPRFGLRLKAQLLSSVGGENGGYYSGSYGSGSNIYSYSDIYQFSLNAGLIIGLGRILSKPRPPVIIRRPPPPPYYRYSPYPPPPPPPYYYH
jgi:hypothetical protein